MKINEVFVLRKVGKDQVVVAIGEASARLNGLIKLNGTGVELWKQLEQGAGRDELADSLAKKYGISREQAEKDVDAFLKPLTDLIRRLIRKGNRKYMIRSHSLFIYQMCNPVCEHACLSGARSRKHEHSPLCRRNRLFLNIA